MILLRQLTSEQVDHIYHLAHRRFRKLIGRRPIKDGYFNPGRVQDEHTLLVLFWYYRIFRKRLWM